MRAPVFLHTSAAACRRCQPLFLQHEENRFWVLLVLFCSKLCKVGVNIFSISISIRRLENKMLMLGVRKLICCKGIRPCSKRALGFSAFMEYGWRLVLESVLKAQYVCRPWFEMLHKHTTTLGDRRRLCSQVHSSQWRSRLWEEFK